MVTRLSVVKVACNYMVVRIALACAMLKNPSIILFDEATTTSALDTVSKSLVQKALEKMMNGRTRIVVAHRLSTMQKYDSIAVIQDGKVAEQGSDSDLLSVREEEHISLKFTSDCVYCETPDAIDLPLGEREG